MYSNFNGKGKDDLFLAVLDAEAKRRFPLHTEALLTARWETEFTLPAREVARGIYHLGRGMGLEALLADQLIPATAPSSSSSPAKPGADWVGSQGSGTRWVGGVDSRSPSIRGSATLPSGGPATRGSG